MLNHSVLERSGIDKVEPAFFIVRMSLKTNRHAKHISI